jgi:hypothetical protein
MFKKSIILILGLAALPLLREAPDAAAQPQTQLDRVVEQAPAVVRQARPRIEVNPRPLLYRRCVDWYELQHRPSGTVLFPQMRCWWVRG